MQLMSSITHRVGIFILFGFLGVSQIAHGQENSPYSRYGLGDIQPAQHILNRGMGGISVAYADAQTVNFTNAASFANLRIVTYDLALSIDARTLRNNAASLKYNSTNFSPSYLALGLPLNRAKGWGAAFGIRPISRINYSLVKNERLTNIDSVETLYEGSGGLNQVFAGIGKRWNNFSIGVMVGYNFGRKETGTKRSFINDTVAYFKSDYNTTTTFGGTFINAGIQYQFMLDSSIQKDKSGTKRRYIRLGASGTLGQKLYAKQDITRETFNYDISGGTYKVDSVYQASNIKGRITIPSTVNAGFYFQETLTDAYNAYDTWGFGAEFTAAKWSDYRFYNQTDALVNNWQVKLGGQWTPNPKNFKSYFSRVNYRAGFQFGKDYINADGKELKQYAVTIGFGLPVRPSRYNPYQFSTVQTAIEIGKRGSGVNNITEGFFRVSLGLSLSDFWFQKRKYD
jgi:hypothetical protein